MEFRVLIEPDEDGVFVAECPVLPGCISQGKTHEEAAANIRDAIQGYLHGLEKHNEPISSPVAEEIVEVQVGAGCTSVPAQTRSRRSDSVSNVSGRLQIRSLQAL